MFYGKNDEKYNDDYNNQPYPEKETHKVNDDINNYDISLDDIEKEIDSLNEKRMRILSVKRQKDEKNKKINPTVDLSMEIFFKDGDIIFKNKLGNEFNLNEKVRREIDKHNDGYKSLYNHLLSRVDSLEKSNTELKSVCHNLLADFRREKIEVGNKTISKKYIKHKKQKDAFNGSYTLWIRNDEKTFYKLPNETPIGANDYHVATQREINDFFKGTKIRERVESDYKYYYYDKATYFSAYCKEHNRMEYSKRLDGKSERIDITKEEYYSHFRKEF